MPAYVTGPWLPLVLLTVAGLALLAFDVFVLPGVGPVGLLGLGSVALALVYGWRDLGGSGVAVVAVMVLAGGAVQVWLAYRLRPWARFVLASRSTAASALPGPTDAAPGVGRRGWVVAPLRPVGRVRFDDDVTEAVSEGDFVGAGEPVEVLRFEGGRTVVGVCSRRASARPGPSRVSGRRSASHHPGTGVSRRAGPPG